jgi:hypothetical protein
MENVLGGGVSILIFILFFQSNKSSSSIRIPPLDLGLILHCLLFSLLEWIFIWRAVARKRRTDISWYFIGISLAFLLIINMSSTIIISQRVSIAPLFLLMVWCGEIIFHEKSRTSVALVLLLIIGACTPLFEINRSVYRTIQYYLQSKVTRDVSGQCLVSQAERVAFPSQPENDHPGQLISDDWYSLSGLDLELITTYVANTSNSFFFKYLAKK